MEASARSRVVQAADQDAGAGFTDACQYLAGVEHIAKVRARSGKILHLGLEPEPLCYLETSAETVKFIEEMRADGKKDERINDCLGVNYDCCHLAVEYEQPEAAIDRFVSHGIRISKLHFSSAMKSSRRPKRDSALRQFVDPVYFHQVIARLRGGRMAGGFARYLISMRRWPQTRRMKRSGVFISTCLCTANRLRFSTLPRIT
jgi:sugar phosphate isomerase/epimerase